jgi:hypothetical protein
VALITTPASKAAAQQICQTKNPTATLMMPKNANTAMQLQQFVANKSLTSDGTFFLGMSKVNGQWIWDDGTAVFVRCEFEGRIA